MVQDVLLAIAMIPVVAYFVGRSLFVQARFRRHDKEPAPSNITPSANGITLVVDSSTLDPASQDFTRAVALLERQGYEVSLVVVTPGLEGAVQQNGHQGEVSDQVRSYHDDRELARVINAIAANASSAVLVCALDARPKQLVRLAGRLSRLSDDWLFALSSSPVDEHGARYRFVGDLRRSRLHVRRVRIRETEEHPVPSLFPSPELVAFDISKFLSIGGLDPDFSTRKSQLAELCLRGWEHGWATAIDPQVRSHNLTASQDARAPSNDIVAADDLLLESKHVDGPRTIIKFALSLAWMQLVEAARGRLNTRVIRLAIARLSDSSRSSVAAPLSTRQALDLAASRTRLEAHWFRGSPEARRLNLLIACPYSIYPPAHGGAVRMYNVVKHLAEYHDIYLLMFVEQESEKVAAVALERYCKEVHCVLRRPRLEHHRPYGLAPKFVTEFESPEFRDTMMRLLDEVRIDVVQLDYTQLAHLVVPSRGWVNVLIEHDVSFVTAWRYFLRERSPLRRIAHFVGWLKTFRHELLIARKFDRICVMSDHDRSILERYLPGARFFVSPNGVDATYYQPTAKLPNRRRLLFVGNFRHQPNVDSVIYFCREILPLIKTTEPDVSLTLVGGNVPQPIAALAGDPSITITGFVPDLRDVYATHDVVVAPIRIGSGVRLKILEAMAAGVPVVSTPIGHEGIELEPERHLLVGDEPAEFAEAVVRLLKNPELAEAIRRSARSLVESKYDWSVLARQLADEYGSAASEVTGRCSLTPAPADLGPVMV